MTGRVVGFPDQLRQAYETAAGGPDLLGGRRPRRIYVCGMGGSAIGGDFLRCFGEVSCPVPIEVVRGYELPRPVTGESFVFFVSYSGRTEETLAAWEEAARRGVPRAAITSGGDLADRADAERVPCLRIPSGSPPRAALGWTSVPLFVALARTGLISCGREDVAEAAAACEEVIARHGPDAARGDPLREWAEACVDALPLIHAPAVPYAACAVRWGTQLNENAKSLAHVALFPEHNHNEIVGWEVPSPLHSRAAVAFLAARRAHPRVRLRMEIVARRIEEARGRVSWFEPEGDGLLARLYSLAALGDLASLHLAAARGVDPTPVASIERLKAELVAPAAGGSG